MTTETATKTHTCELTPVLLQVLLNMTSAPDCWTDKTRSLAVALHRARHLGASGNWKTELTEQDVKTLHYIVQVYTLDRPSLRTRFNNRMTKHCESYARIHAAYLAELEEQKA